MRKLSQRHIRVEQTGFTWRCCCLTGLPTARGILTLLTLVSFVLQLLITDCNPTRILADILIRFSLYNKKFANFIFNERY